MKISTRFSDSIHILAFINIYQGTIPLTSNNIASSIETSPVVVRRLMSALNKAGLINTVHGAAQCIVGGNIQETLDGFYQQAETAAKAKLARTSLQDVIDTIRVKQAIKDAEKERKS